MGGRRATAEPLAEAPAGWLTARDAGGQFPFQALVEHSEWAALIPGIERAGGDGATALPRLAAYIAAVLSWNRTVSNLISRSDEARLVSRHLAESIEPAGWLREFGAARWVDLGSGA
jgi:hypothetical protein